MEALDDVSLEGFSLFLVGVVFFIGYEVSVCSVESEHQTMKFAVSGDGDL